MAKKASAAIVSPIDAHLGFWMRLVSNHVSGEFRKQVEKQGVTVSEWVALRALFGVEGATHAALMEFLGMTKGAVSKIVSRLESKGLAERHAVDSDARAQVLVLTKRGRALVPKLAALADGNDHRFFGHLAAAQHRDLLLLLQELARRHQLKEVPVG